MNFQTERELRDSLYEQFARICKALGSARRFELISLLSQGEHSVEQLARETNMTVANTSQHLQHLKSSRLVLIRRKGVEIYYRLADTTVFNLVQSVQFLANSQLAEVDRIVDELVLARADIRLMPTSELEEAIHTNNILIIDVRPHSEYQYAHIEGAISIPLGQLEAEISTIPTGKKIVVYCRNYYSSLSDHAVKYLGEQGLDVYRLENGFSEWKFQGKEIQSEL
ncbi:MAG: metalloregulator ArsR/SmtB family transcription factor [Anaerolineaceae bacterium]|nr:metalloregulator ArsR/SmtB family transcription factor [Anaerolineaceae bacterium]